MSIPLLKKSNLVPAAIVLAVFTLIYIVFINDNNGTPKLLDMNNYTPDIVKQKKADNTIASAWQWSTTTTKNPTNSVETFDNKKSQVFSEESIYQALKRIRLDDNNNLIIDHETLIALNETLDDDRLQLDNQSLSELQVLIKKGLSGDAGYQVAKIVEDYYHYLEAVREFNSVYESNSDEDEIKTPTQEHEAVYRELISLREQYLDTSVATNLFSIYDANANYMFNMQKIDDDENLTEEEKQHIRAEIIQKHTEKTINIKNWTTRYQDFFDAKQNITMAVISDIEKKTQLTELMHQHFNREELIHVQHLQLNKP